MADPIGDFRRSCPYTGVGHFMMSIILLLPRISDCLSSIWIRPAVALVSIPFDIEQPQSCGCSAVLVSPLRVRVRGRVRGRVKVKVEVEVNAADGFA